MNTLLNAFVSYCALRESGFSVRLAYKNIGPKYGDDSIDIVIEKLGSTVNDLGLTIKIDTIKANNDIPFLGRIFINPWCMVGSVCDPKRSILKLHVGTKKYPPDVALVHKVMGYNAVDSHVPIIGDFCSYVFRSRSPCNVKITDKEIQFKIDRGPYPQDCSKDDYLRVVASSIGLDIQSVQNIQEKIQNATTDDDITGCLRFHVPIELGNEKLRIV
jgi:hypothetical protein